MKTIGITTKLTLATKDQRVDLKSFYKAIESSSYKNLTMELNAGASGTLDLTLSDYVIVVGLESNMQLTVTNSEATPQSIMFSDVGFLSLNASNLASLVVLNSSSETRNIEIYY